MRDENALRRPLLALTAVGGVVAAHMLDYAVVVGDAGQRTHYLQETGHGYWAAALVAGSTAASLGVGVAVWCGLRRALGLIDAASSPHPIGFAPLALAQVGLFAGMEVTERLVAGAPLAGLAHGPLFALGLVLQVVVAAGAVLLLRLVASGVAKLAARRPRRPRRALAGPLRRADVALPPSMRWGAAGCRGPPTLRLS